MTPNGKLQVGDVVVNTRTGRRFEVMDRLVPVHRERTVNDLLPQTEIDELLADPPPPDYRPVLVHPRTGIVHRLRESEPTATCCGLRVDGPWERTVAAARPVSCRRCNPWLGKSERWAVVPR